MTPTGRRSPRRGRWGRWLAAALPFLLVALATPVLRDLPPIAMLEAASLDWRHRLRGARPPSAPVAVVAIDDRTVQAHDGWPIPRDTLARAVERLYAQGARVVAFDLLLTEPSRTAGADDALAEVLRRHPNTLLPVAFTFAEAGPAPPADLSGHSLPLLRRGGAAGAPEAAGVLAPAPPLAQAASGIGHVNVVLGPGGSLRQLHPAIAMAGQALPALPVVAVQRFRGLDREALALRLPGGLQLGDRRVPVGPDGRWTLNFYGPHTSFPTLSLRTVLAGPRGPNESLRGRIVWIGATATAIGDNFATPFDPELPGVAAFATATANLLNEDFLERDAWTSLAAMLAVLAIGLATSWAIRLQPTWLAVALTPLPLAAWVVVTAVAFSAWHVWLNLSVPALAGVAAIVGLAGWRLLLTESQRRRLASYLPDRLVEDLAEADQPSLEGHLQRAAVLFVDLSGFTQRSEAASPADTATMLQRLHTVFEDGARAHDGYVDNFTGDGAMLVFGVPQPSPADGANALACAHRLLAQAEAEGFGIRIGVHCGEVQLARLGGRHQHHFSLAGDTVNVASRLMDVAKKYGAVLAVSEAVAAVTRERAGAELLSGLSRSADEPIRGRRAHVDVWIYRPESESPERG